MKNGVISIFFSLVLSVLLWYGCVYPMEENQLAGTKRKWKETSKIEKKRKIEKSTKKAYTIGIIGATGNVGLSTSVGLTVANTMTKNFTGDTLFSKLLLWGSNRDESKVKCHGEAYDLSDSKTLIEAVENVADIAQADIIIITAGKAQQPGQTRDVLFAVNKDIIAQFITDLHSSPDKNEDALIIMVTNPVEDLTQIAYMTSKNLGYLRNPEKQIIGSGTLLDTNRLHNSIRHICKVPLNEISAYALGEHGELVFVPWSQAKINETKLTEDQQRQTVEETRKRVYDIINLKGYTQHGIANCLVILCNAIITNDTTAYPVSVYHPHYQVYLSVPAQLGRSGIRNIVSFPLNPEEQTKLQACVNKRKAIIAQLEKEHAGESSA